MIIPGGEADQAFVAAAGRPLGLQVFFFGFSRILLLRQQTVSGEMDENLILRVEGVGYIEIEGIEQMHDQENRNAGILQRIRNERSLTPRRP